MPGTGIETKSLFFYTVSIIHLGLYIRIISTLRVFGVFFWFFAEYFKTTSPF